MRTAASGLYVMTYYHPGGRRGWSFAVPNGVTIPGVNYLLNTGFRGGAKSTTWFLGLIDDSGFSALNPLDTLASHSGWGEFTGIYLGSRPAWAPAAPGAGLMGYTTQALFQITAAGAVRGAFLADRQPTGLSSGILYSTGAMTTGRPVVAGGTLTVGYATKLQ